MTKPYCSRSFLLIAAIGFFSSVAQVIYIREALPVFSGNELILGFILAVWLLAGAAGNRLGYLFKRLSCEKLTLFYFICFTTAIYGLRSSRLFFLPGEAVSPLWAGFILVLTEGPFAFLSGTVFSVLSAGNDGRKLYRWENAGAPAGLVLVSVGILFSLPNAWIAATALLVLFPFLKKPRYMAVAAALVLLFLAFDKSSVRWKYSTDASQVVYGPQGEVALAGSNGLVLLNNVLYRSGIVSPLIEQAVHAPMSVRKARRVLLVQDKGHAAEIRKYPGIKLTCLESEPSLVDSGCLCGSPETFEFSESFDVVLIGSGNPDNIASGRFFTESFFRRMHSLMSDSGILSFTLDFNANYLDKKEKGLRDVLIVTLSEVFRYVRIFPGEGYTFMASNADFELPSSCHVTAPYFQQYILPSLTAEKISLANIAPTFARINTADRPLAIAFELDRYLNRFANSRLVLPFVAAILLIFASLFFIRSSSMMSVGSTGFTVGVYSIELMLLYQSLYGTLYSRLSILMIALSIGFALGSLVRRFFFSDLVIGAYALLTLLFMINYSYPPLVLFLFFNSGIGFLAGAQFVTSKEGLWADLNASDMAGGIFGMALGPTLLFPLLGISNIAVLLVVIKLSVAAVRLFRRR